MMILTIERNSRVPAYKQICEQVVGLVESAALAPGDHLPPTRVLARSIGVHRSTVLHAYGELWALGYLESRPGSYSTVRRPAPTTAATGQSRGTGVIDWAAVSNPTVREECEDAVRQAHEPARPEVIDLGRLSADRRLTPTDDLRRCLRAAMLEEGRDLLDYGDPAGYPPLREAIARRMRVHGVAIAADEVIITAGAQQALDLVLRLMARPGDRIATESPTYGAALSLFRFHALQPIDIRMRPDGLDLDALGAALDAQRPVLLYTVPNFHNPTGITTSQAHRERLLALCESRRVPVVEDGFEEEMKYFGKAVLPIKAMDTQGSVIYVGTFSKVVFPGLRIGWIAAPRECVRRMVAIQGITCLSGNVLAQAVAARFCESGSYEAHLRRIHKVYRRRMQAMLAGLAEHMPPGVEWTRPAGGYTLWLGVGKSRLDERTLFMRLLQDGVSVAPGSLFVRTPPAQPSFRLSIACASEEEIAEGCRRLGRSLSSVRRRT
jgi:DNA-binding transcriptional MocR family regulator